MSTYYTGKSKITAGILALLLGGFGIHKFYLGKPLQGILYILFSWTFIPAIVAAIEGIIYLTMSDQAFAVKYGGAPAAYSTTPLAPPYQPQHPQQPYALPPLNAPAAAPQGEKKCPRCAEMVKVEAKFCRYCGHDFDASGSIASWGRSTKEV